MNKLRAKFTLPELQEKLDTLAAGALFQIASWDYERLFGTDDAAAVRLRNFAKSHACVASYSDGNGNILFRKQLTLQEGGELPSLNPQA